MAQKNLGLWIEELDAAIEKLQKRVDKIVAGGGFDPSVYVYTTPFIDQTTGATRITPNDDADQNIVYTATAPCFVIFDVAIDKVAFPSFLSAAVQIRQSAESVEHVVMYPSYGQDDVSTGIAYLNTGQVLFTYHATKPGSHYDVYQLASSQLQDAPVGLLGQIVRKVKKAIKGGE